MSYNHQIPPGAGQTVHYGLELPENITQPITVDVALRYRKFDQSYMEIVASRQLENDKPLPGRSPDGTYRGELPITTLAEDSVVFPIGRQPDGNQVDGTPQQTSDISAWMRWNDYGIGLLLKGKAELRQAAEAFTEVEKLGRYDGPLNLARVLYREGRLDEAVEAVRRAAEHDDPAAPPWTVAWLSGLINREQGHLDEAEQNFRSVLQSPNEAMRKRGFDFRQDYEVINLLGQTLFDQARRLRGKQHQERRSALLQQAVEQFNRTLQLDPENATAHFGLQQIYAQLGNQQARQWHQDLHLKYKPDDNARDRAVAAARKKYPAANKAAEAVVIYDLGASR
jgi:tetratricopeptide (TPR) repeat protein